MKAALSVKILFSLVVVLSALGAAGAKESGCIACHKMLGEKHEQLISSFEHDVHKEKGFSCHACHGGNPKTDDITLAKSSKAGFVGKPSEAETPQFCGKCHSDPVFMKKFNPAVPVDQEGKYWTSVHGKRLKMGDAKVATCSSCHPAHSIRKPGDPLSSVFPKNVAQTCAKCHSNKNLMAEYKISTDQFDKYMKSVHANALFKKGDISAPTCNDCHGNHGATPPGPQGVALICGQCHVHNLEFFRENPMAKAWSERGFHACAVCHSHHAILPPSVEMLAGEKAVCMKCHKPGDKGSSTGMQIKKLIEQLDQDFHATHAFVQDVERKKGMDVTEAHDQLQESRQSLIQMKTAVHTFNPEKVKAISSKGGESIKKARQIAVQALREFWKRRIGLGVSTFIITLLAVALYLKLKDMER